MVIDARYFFSSIFISCVKLYCAHICFLLFPSSFLLLSLPLSLPPLPISFLSAGSLTHTAYGTNTNYTAFNIKSPSLHFAVMTGLTPSSSYYYRVGNDQYGWSSVFPFTSAPSVGDTSIYPISFITYGDMGISNSEHTANLTAKLIQSGQASFILHTGDISCE